MFGRQDRFDALISKLTEALANRQSDPLLLQHLGDCVRRQDKIEETLGKQNEASLKMHKESQAAREKDNKDANTRFIKVLLLLIAGLLSPFLEKTIEALKTLAH